jgi:hypothetical protein
LNSVYFGDKFPSKGRENMPTFASVAAHTVIDTLALLLWHKYFVSRICRERMRLEQVKSLVDAYLRQCQLLPLPLISRALLSKRRIEMREIRLTADRAV